MADTETKTRARRGGQTTESRARRAAVADAEPRDDQGRFKKESSGRSSKSSTGTSGRTSRSGTSSRGSGSKLDGKGAMIAAGAAGLAVGLAANVARKLAVQAPTLISGDWDQALANEHALTLKVFDAIEATSNTSTTKRAALLANLKHMLTKHALEEENVIYPALREAGEIEAADHLNNDHGYVKQYLYELTELPKDSPAWLAKVRQFRTDIEKHMREEEDQLFPRLKAKLGTKNAEITTQMNKEGLKIA